MESIHVLAKSLSVPSSNIAAVCFSVYYYTIFEYGYLIRGEMIREVFRNLHALSSLVLQNDFGVTDPVERVVESAGDEQSQLRSGQRVDELALSDEGLKPGVFQVFWFEDGEAVLWSFCGDDECQHEKGQDHYHHHLILLQ